MQPNHVPVRRSSAPHAVRIVSGVSFAATALLLAGCGNTYRPVVSAINPVGPAAQPTKYAVAVSANGSASNGLVTIIDYSGDTILDTTALGVNPFFFVLDTSGTSGYTLNGDNTVNSFPISTSLIASGVNQTTLVAGAAPISITPQGTNLYIAQPGRNSVAQLTQTDPPALKQELPTGATPVYTVVAPGAPRAYALVQNGTTGAGSVASIETATNTISATLPVGVNPVYGVMTVDGRRAFILNKGSNTLSVINSQTNAPDVFTVNGSSASTIPVGTAPVWADFAPSRAELVVANAGNGTTAGSVSIINIPLCNATTVTTNPNCDPNNPLDAAGFGTVLATIPVGVNPVMVAVLQDGTQAYVANAGNTAAGIAGSVSVINLQTNTVTATIAAVAGDTTQNDAVVHGHPTWIAVTTGTPTGKAYVTALDSTDISIIRTDTNVIQTHLPLQGNGVSVRVTVQ